MPVKSKSQLRFLFAAEARKELPKGTARKWIEHTDEPINQLPERISVNKKKGPVKTALLSGSSASMGSSMLNPIPAIPQPKMPGIQAAAQQAGQTNLQQMGPPTSPAPSNWVPGVNGQTLYPPGQGPVSGQVPKTASLGERAAKAYLAKKGNVIA